MTPVLQSRCDECPIDLINCEAGALNSRVTNTIGGFLIIIIV